MDKPSSVLFACNLNIVRSPMAEGLLRFLSGNRIYADSCGVRAGEELDAFAVAVMEEIGIDISGHKPRDFDSLWDSSFDLIVSLTPEAQHKAADFSRTNATQIVYWPCPDPTLTTGSREQKLESYRRVRDQLHRQINELIDWKPPPSV